MNVIVFSRRLGRARQFELGRPVALTVTIMIVATLLTAVLFAGVQLGRTGTLMEPVAQVGDWSRKLEEQRKQVATAKRDLQERLDALAGRVGQMNAHVIRLDALGRRLTEMAKLDKGEFNFDSAPALGGPEGLLEGAVVGSADITGMRSPSEPSDTTSISLWIISALRPDCGCVSSRMVSQSKKLCLSSTLLSRVRLCCTRAVFFS